MLLQFDVERREQDTRISICCATKPGLLLSTVNTLEALGLEIHQCVITSFNDFSMQASCSEVCKNYVFRPLFIYMTGIKCVTFLPYCLNGFR